MFKRSVTLLLLCTILLTQWASGAQCHCHEAGEHSDRPHIHLTGFPFATPERQQHEVSGCCHRHGGDDDSDGAAGSVPPLGDDDDAGIIYLPTPLLHGWLSGQFSPPTQDDGADTGMPPCGSAGLCGLAVPVAGMHHPPPVFAASGCPTFLLNLTLLI